MIGGSGILCTSKKKKPLIKMKTYTIFYLNPSFTKLCMMSPIFSHLKMVFSISYTSGLNLVEMVQYLMDITYMRSQIASLKLHCFYVMLQNYTASKMLFLKKTSCQKMLKVLSLNS